MQLTCCQSTKVKECENVYFEELVCIEHFKLIQEFTRFCAQIRPETVIELSMQNDTIQDRSDLRTLVLLDFCFLKVKFCCITNKFQSLSAFISYLPLVYQLQFFWLRYVFKDLGGSTLFQLDEPNIENVQWDPSLLFPKSARSRSKKYSLKKLQKVQYN